MKFSENFLNELVARNDIESVVGEYVKLEKRSGSNLFGRCPFHNERTPSFSVSPDKQIYHCFGCGKGGGVINFIMEHENLKFPEAVEVLAKRVGMEMPEGPEDEFVKRKQRMLALNRDAARFFHERLYAPEGEPGRQYMANRGIDRKTATNFGVGYAPNSWNALLDAMKAKGYREEELFQAGLARQGKKGGFYDVFRSRLMFPVIDVKGNVIGFSGRIIGDGEPKYMNSPETLVFNKSRNLFALNLAKKSKAGYIILSEGNIDVVSLHQAGFDSAVASLGTSLTPEQARLISGYTNEVIIAYDNDGAGIKATQRAIGILEKLDLKVKVLRVDGAKDPDEYLKKRGPDAFRNLIQDSENRMDYRLRQIQTRYDLNSDEGRVEYVKEAVRMLAALPGAVERQVYSGKVADAAGLKTELVSTEVEKQRRKMLSSAGKQKDRENSMPVRQAQPRENSIRYSNPESAVAEEGIIRLLYLDQSLAKGSMPAAEKFSSPELANIYRLMLQHIQSGTAISTAVMGADLSGDEMSLLIRILQKPETPANAEEALRDYTAKIYAIHERNSVTDLNEFAKRYKSTKSYKQEDT